MTDILTLQLDPASQAHFEDMRQQYFPPARNQVPAHLSLFHSLPATEEVRSTLLSVAAAAKPFPMMVNGLRSLGRGVAYTLVAPEVTALHKELSHLFAAHLTPQDRQKFQPHIVIQNKSTGERARNLLTLLKADFQPFVVQAEGLNLWHYQNGPWELAQQYEFAG